MARVDAEMGGRNGSDLVIDVGDVDGAADDLVALRHAGAAVGPPPAGVAVAAEPSTGSSLLHSSEKTGSRRSSSAGDIGNGIDASRGGRGEDN